LVDGSGSLVPANYVLFDNNAFGLVSKSAGGVLSRQGPTWGQLATCNNGLNGVGVSADCDGVPNNVVRYDTPTFQGFSASASWGEDDIWAIAGRYAAEFNGIKISSAIAYTESTDFGTGLNAGRLLRGNVGALQAGLYLQHVPTGLFVYGAYGKDDNKVVIAGASALTNKPDGDNFYIKAGVRTKLNSLGHTVFYGEYGENNDKMTSGLFNQGVTGSNVEQWGLGLVQEVDAAAMSVWLTYRSFSADQNCALGNTNAACAVALGAGVAGKAKFEDLDLVKVGALINF
jgi:hypothetical protein